MQNNTDINNPHFKMKTLSMFATCLTLLLAFTGCERQGDFMTTLSDHSVTIVTPGGRPYGYTSKHFMEDEAGNRTDSLTSANGKYNLEITNGVLTMNGVKYTLEKPESEIRITEDRVEINGVEATPDEG